MFWNVHTGFSMVFWLFSLLFRPPMILEPTKNSSGFRMFDGSVKPNVFDVIFSLDKCCSFAWCCFDVRLLDAVLTVYDNCCKKMSTVIKKRYKHKKSVRLGSSPARPHHGPSRLKKWRCLRQANRTPSGISGWALTRQGQPRGDLWHVKFSHNTVSQLFAAPANTLGTWLRLHLQIHWQIMPNSKLAPLVTKNDYATEV